MKLKEGHFRGVPTRVQEFGAHTRLSPTKGMQ